MNKKNCAKLQSKKKDEMTKSGKSPKKISKCETDMTRIDLRIDVRMNKLIAKARKK